MHITKEETDLVNLKNLSLESNTVCNDAGLHAYGCLACQLSCVSYSVQPGPSQARWYCTLSSLETKCSRLVRDILLQQVL